MQLGVVVTSRRPQPLRLQLRRCRRRSRPSAAATTEDDSSLDLRLVERSLDFGDLEYIEVEDRETCSSFRSALDHGDVEHVFSTTDVTSPVASSLDRDQMTGSGSIWMLGLMTVAYLHCCSTGFSIPALLPSIAADSSLTDNQGAFLTVGFTLVFAFFQVPFGFLADKLDRTKMLSAGVVVWSVVTSLASKATNFSDLMLIRLSTAAAQSMQNPISYSLIPELFPKKRTTAMAMYNCALYFGRALSFFFALILAKFGVEGMLGIHTVPLDQFDVSTMSMLYVNDNQAIVAPLFDYEVHFLSEASTWRDLLFWIGVPGLGIAYLLTLVPDPRGKTNDAGPASMMQIWPTIQTIVQSRSFQATTLAASLNDIGFWSLISWQSLFYERVFHLPPNVYAPILATVIPLSGIVGGVGGGLAADWLTQRNLRYLLTFGATLVGAPLIFLSLEAGDYQSSFVYLLFGYCFLECYRASSAIMVRQSSPADAVSTGAAVHLFSRNLLASIGPILIATMEPIFGLRNAMWIIPGSYLLSAFTFAFAERLLKEEEMRTDLSMD